jgi:hypothetical protein
MKHSIMKIGLTVVLGILALRPEAIACGCGGWTEFETVVTRAPIVVVGDVVSARANASNNIEAIEIEIEFVAKGEIQDSRISVWNDGAVTDCGSALGRAMPDTRIAVTLNKVADQRASAPLYWAVLRDLIGFNPPSDDFVLAVGCGDNMLLLSEPGSRERWNVVSETMRAR